MKNRAENESKLFLLRHCLWTMQGVALHRSAPYSIYTQMACRNPNRSMEEIERRRATCCKISRKRNYGWFIGNHLPLRACKWIHFKSMQFELQMLIFSEHQSGWLDWLTVLQSTAAAAAEEAAKKLRSRLFIYSVFSAIATVRNEMIQILGILLEIVAAAVATATAVVVETEIQYFPMHWLTGMDWMRRSGYEWNSSWLMDSCQHGDDDDDDKGS